jgi:hypothetical protein
MRFFPPEPIDKSYGGAAEVSGGLCKEICVSGFLFWFLFV